jgi:caspase domain-containing protein
MAPQASAKRVAFVVGVDAYDNLPAQEQKAVNDAHALGEALTGLGYRSSAPTMPTAAVSTRIGRNS